MAEDSGLGDKLESSTSEGATNHTSDPVDKTTDEGRQDAGDKTNSNTQNDVHTGNASGEGEGSRATKSCADRDCGCQSKRKEGDDEKEAETSSERTENKGSDRRKRGEEGRDDRSRVSNSNTSSDSETESDEEGSKQESDHDICSDMENEILGRHLPAPKSQALHEIRAREFGHYQRCPLPYCLNFMGSIPLVERLDKYCELKHHEGCVNTLHFNPGGDLLASGSDDLEIVLWDWAQQKPKLIFESGHRSNVFQAKFMPCSGDATLVSCARDGQVRVAELSTTGVCKETKKIVQHKGAAHKLGLEPDSPVVFMSCGEDAAVFNIDLREQKHSKLMVVKENDRKVALYTIFVNPSNINQFIVGGRDQYVRVYDKRKITDEENSGLVKKFCPDSLKDNDQVKANVTCCLYSYNGQEILASYNDEDIYLFDSSHSDGADFIHAYRGHRNNATVKGVNFYGPKSEYIVSGSDCGNVFLWEKESEKIVQYMQGDVGGVVNCLEPHPLLPCLATSGLDHDVKVWLPTRSEPTPMDGLKKLMMTNRREREEERVRGPEFEDNAMLRFLMAHLRHRARRQAREAGDLDSSDSDDSSDSSEDLPTAQCATS
ncbi:DDB1- and CUL4-associated factor 8-like [Lytechinus variegatus]|uniref:DDB1- and CUL4-associated factor 8-like n=1 Tax=Lytechinus variegatus TaxID=7654 RepID=UPI001BB0DD3A|nr:DDB1- and CUL4-associated factor 8-like [Lytechinus variegatus]XP_041470690.1 DDB1- and CUL4-associated factor 8-like [Lytechinus variegatus]XP_041470691.1 DDB1- and CUL4-associated factor 8-like [Lytechinus variegatus]XP_041470693.1 DDB1- and CUL4-associated factor 8-like [Lytechinus variegatus]